MRCRGGLWSLSRSRRANSPGLFLSAPLLPLPYSCLCRCISLLSLSLSSSPTLLRLPFLPCSSSLFSQLFQPPFSLFHSSVWHFLPFFSPVICTVSLSLRSSPLSQPDLVSLPVFSLRGDATFLGQFCSFPNT